MRTSQAGIALVQQFEGLRLNVYLDAAGLPSIGWGHLIKPGEHFNSIDKAKADEILKADLRNTENAVTRLVTMPLAQHQFDALVSLVFNIGVGAFERSTALRRLNDGDMAGVPDAIRMWDKVKKRPVLGLTRRREAEAKLFAAKP